ncbi:lens fiber membrane intrinsic protein-like [Oscarella lobularis]|uniref:lens fiber membrane intrinsic protein-like n=1 Tax=Oscarella lobularis TaxID=121494 RepID=UPI00331315C0
MNGVAVVCFALVFVGVGLSVASLVTPYWIQWKFKYRDTIYQHNGLWKFCQDGNCTTSCTSDIPRLGVTLHVVRAFAVASVLLSLPVFLLLAVNCKKALRWSLRTSAIVLFLQAILFIISLGVYAAKEEAELIEDLDVDYSFGYSFMLGLLAVAAFIVEAFVFLCAGHRFSKDSYNAIQ